MIDKIIFSRESVEIGKDKDGYKLLIDIEIKEPQEEIITIDHKIIKKPHYSFPMVAGVHTLSISGGAWNGRKKDFEYYGQIYDELIPSNIKSYTNGWNSRKVMDLVAIWKRWHLNDLQAGCIHQTDFSVNTEDWQKRADEETLNCPDGYKYGSAWLIEPLPADVEKKIMALFKETTND